MSDDESRTPRWFIALFVGSVLWIVLVVVVGYLAYQYREPVPVEQWERASP